MISNCKQTNKQQLESVVERKEKGCGNREGSNVDASHKDTSASNLRIEWMISDGMLMTRLGVAETRDPGHQFAG